MKIKTHGNLWLTKIFATMLHKTFYTDAKSKTNFLCFNWNNYNKVSAFIIFRIAKTLGFFASWYYNSYQKLKFSLIRYPTIWASFSSIGLVQLLGTVGHISIFSWKSNIFA